MSSSTALLPKAKKDDVPIFLRVCHAPWVSISQKSLIYIRGFIAVYLAATFIMIFRYEISNLGHGLMILFELPIISYLLQVIYAWITFSWAFFHLNYPHHGSAAPCRLTGLQKLLSPPRQHPATKNQVFFSIFYTACVSYAHVVTLVYWLILVRHIEIPGIHDTFGTGWYRSYCISNLYGINSVIAVIEVLILCSIRRQKPIWAHLVGLTALSLIYVGWAFVGKLLTGKFAYYFFDCEKIGWEYALIAVVAFCVVSNIFFAVVYGVTGVREMLTAKCEDRASAVSGYTRLPQ